MKKLFFFIVIPLCSFIVSDWITTSIDSHVSLRFPSQPTTAMIGNNPTWESNDTKLREESSIRCVAMIVDLKTMGLDSARITEDIEKPATLEEFRIGLMGKLTGGKLLLEKKSSLAGYPTFEYIVDLGTSDSVHLNMIHSKNVFVGTTLYSLMEFEALTKPQDEIRELFFNSFSVQK